MANHNDSCHPSNHAQAFMTLRTREVQWRQCKMEDPVENLFVQEYKLFAEACGLSEDVKRGKRALSLLKQALTEEHSDESELDEQLFEALKKVIGKNRISAVGSDGKAFVLKNSRVGFRRQVYRTNLNFDKNYAASENSRTDHTCVVFKCGSTRKVADYIVQDTTAIVELKFNMYNCDSFTLSPENEVLDEPDSGTGHGPVAQALFYLFDSWHCLARRGIQENQLNVLVLGGRSDNRSYNDKLCCVDVTLNIPEFCSNLFCYSINLAVKFGDNNYEEIAIAAYLRMMRLGLKRAFKITNQQLSIPKSLCCRRLSYGGIELSDAELVASPIPDASTIAQGLSVRQGELFRWRPVHGGWVAHTGLVFDCSRITNTMLIKLQCITVHNSLILPRKSHDALSKLRTSGNGTLLKELSKVLIAYNEESDSTYVMVMHDLSQRQDSDVIFEPLSPTNFEGNMSMLWTAFSRLVMNVLVPMADVEVVHADIRPGWKQTSNILCREDQGTAELRLIDLNSLCKYPLPSLKDRRCMQNRYSTSIKSAHQFVWWQVMHVAYIWSEQLDNDDSKSMLAYSIVKYLFKSNEFENFRNFLGQRWDKDIDLDNINKESIKTLLEVVETAFNREENST